MTRASYQKWMTHIGRDLIKKANSYPTYRSHPQLYTCEWNNVDLFDTQMCSHSCAGICMHVHPVRMCLCVCLFVSLLFSHPLSVSLSGHLCIFPLRGNLPACIPPFLNVLFAAKWLLSRSVFRIFLAAKKIHISLSVFCAFPAECMHLSWRSWKFKRYWMKWRCQREWQHCQLELFPWWVSSSDM